MTFKLTKIAAAATVVASLTFSLAFAADATTTDNTATANSTTTTAAPTIAPTMMDHGNTATDSTNQAADQNNQSGEQADSTANGMNGGTNEQDTSSTDATTPSNSNGTPTMQDGSQTPSTNSNDDQSSNMNGATNSTDSAAANKIYVAPSTTNKDAATTNTDANNKTPGTQSNAVIPQEKLLDFAQKAALASFTYDYSNYQQDMKNMQSYFTKTGWESFNKALTASNNLDVVQKEKLTVTAKMNGEAKVTQHQQTATGQEWQVTVPVIVTYKNDKNQQIQQDLKVKLAIDTVDTNVNPNGIGINQFIAMPDGNATSEKSS